MTGALLLPPASAAGSSPTAAADTTSTASRRTRRLFPESSRSNHNASVRGLTFPLLVAASLAALVGCGTGEAREKPLSRSAAQALRVCVDRWNEAHMRDWGPARASVGRRRLDAARLAAIGLRRGPRRCVVSLAVGRSTTSPCVVASP